MTWIETGSFRGGQSPLVRYDEIVMVEALPANARLDYPGKRSVLYRANGQLIYCQATVETMKERLLQAEDLAVTDSVVVPQELTVRLVLGG